MTTNTASQHVNQIGTQGTHTVLILDLLLKPSFDTHLLNQTLDAILAFGISILMQSGANRLSIIGSSTVKNAVLYLDEQIDDAVEATIRGGQMEKFAGIMTVFQNNTQKWIKECTKLVAEGQGRDHQPKTMLSGATSQALCLLNRHQASYASSRIVIFSLTSNNSSSDHYSSQYMHLINCFFAGQKLNIIFDCCTISLTSDKEDSASVSASMEDRFSASILQQGADLTGGRYICVHKVSTLLEHLFWCFTPNATERTQLVLPPKLKISPPAACFCHRKVLEIGYVCSVCVSIFCQYLPYCTTCYSNVFGNNLKRMAGLKAATNGGKMKNEFK